MVSSMGRTWIFFPYLISGQAWMLWYHTHQSLITQNDLHQSISYWGADVGSTWRHHRAGHAGCCASPCSSESAHPHRFHLSGRCTQFAAVFGLSTRLCLHGRAAAPLSYSCEDIQTLEQTHGWAAFAAHTQTHTYLWQTDNAAVFIEGFVHD